MEKLICICFLLFSIPVNAQIPRHLTHEMNRFDVNTVLLFESQSIDYHPVWSSNSRYIMFHLNQRWVKMDLTQVSFQTGEWNHQTIGINQTEVFDSVFSQDLNRQEIENDTVQRRIVYTGNAEAYELKLTADLTTQFIHHRGKKSTVIWETGGDNCHSIVLAPNNSFLAFISEANGLMLYCIDKKAYKTNIPESAKLINKALNLFEKKDTPKVEHLLNRAYKKDSTSAEPLVWRAFLKMYVGKKDDAVRLMNRAITRNSQNATYFYFRAQILFTANDIQGAIDSYTYYTQLKPFDSHGYYELGTLYELLNDKENACINYTLARKYYSNRALNKIGTYCN